MRVPACLLLASAVAAPLTRADDPPPVPDAVKKGETDRVELIRRTAPAIVAVYTYAGQSMGSGVVIDPAGYFLTNYHVAEAAGYSAGNPFCRGGLSDGVMYEAVVVGVDPVGDTALMKLLPTDAGKPFPFLPLGDSDQVRVGHWAMTMGNPAGFAADLRPSVGFGLVSGTNRYFKVDEKSVLEPTDVLQVDASAGPGSSGGPVVNMKGEVIGLVYGGPVRRGVNTGTGFALSSNQVKHFLGHLYAGGACDHATLGALIGTADEENQLSKMVVKQILDDSDAYRRGLRDNDQLLTFAGRTLLSTNQYRNVLGIYPKDWRVPVVYKRGADKREVLVRLQGSLPTVKGTDDSPDAGPKPTYTGPKPAAGSPLAKLYKEKKGYANFHFNEVEQKRLLTAFAKYGDFAGAGGPWAAEGGYIAPDRTGPMRFELNESGADAATAVTLTLNITKRLEPLKPQDVDAQLEPVRSGGLMMALYHYRRLMTLGAKGFEGEFAHAGFAPFYPPGAPGQPAAARKVECEVLKTRHGSVECRWYFGRADQKLVGFETFVVKGDDPCEVFLADYKDAGDGRQLPHRLDVWYRDKAYATLTVAKYTLGKTP